MLRLPELSLQMTFLKHKYRFLRPHWTELLWDGVFSEVVRASEQTGVELV